MAGTNGLQKASPASGAHRVDHAECECFFEHPVKAIPGEFACAQQTVRPPRSAAGSLKSDAIDNHRPNPNAPNGEIMSKFGVYEYRTQPGFDQNKFEGANQAIPMKTLVITL